MRNFCLLAVFSILCLSACSECVEPDTCIDPSKIDSDAACIEIYEPVCGCDGMTYDNSCFAEISGVMSWTEGVCGN
jgi:hypothetical protein